MVLQTACFQNWAGVGSEKKNPLSEQECTVSAGCSCRGMFAWRERDFFWFSNWRLIKKSKLPHWFRPCISEPAVSSSWRINRCWLAQSKNQKVSVYQRVHHKTRRNQPNMDVGIWWLAPHIQGNSRQIRQNQPWLPRTFLAKATLESGLALSYSHGAIKRNRLATCADKICWWNILG